MNGGDLLVVAGEASGDRAGAAVIADLPAGLRTFGMGGAALASVGVEVVTDLRDTTALGVAETARRAFGVARAYAVLQIGRAHV